MFCLPPHTIHLFQPLDNGLLSKEPLERGMRAADDVMKVSLGIYIPMHACMSHIGAITCALAAIPSFSHALQKYSCLLHSRNGSELVTIPK